MLSFLRILKQAASDFSQDDCMSSAAAMAYYAIFSLPPLLVLVVAIAGYFGVRPEDIQRMVQDQWGVAAADQRDSEEQNGGAEAERQNEAKSETRKEANALGIVTRVVGVAILIFSATGLFAQLQYTLNRAWEVKPDPKRGGVMAFVMKRVLSFGMILVVVFLLLVSMVLTTIIDEVIAYLRGGAPEEAAVVLGITLNNIVAFVVATLLFAAMFQMLPDAKMSWKDVWFGAVLTGLLFVIGKTLIGLYLKNTDLGSNWGSAAASVIGVLVWMYYSSLIVLFGAELTQAWATTRGHGIRPAAGAVAAKEEDAPLFHDIAAINFVAPMEALSVEEIPEVDDWQYEPKWDGFRCLAFRRGMKVDLRSKSGKPLTRYFPEVAAELAKQKAETFVLDGEIVIPLGSRLSFNDLLMRIHPAESRIRKLAEETPAMFIAFDLLEDADGPLIELPLAKRRRKLESFAKREFRRADRVAISPATTDVKVARRWFASAGKALDGIIAKRADFDYRSGDRTGMQKIKKQRTADCVVGGFRYATSGRLVGSLLLGLYDKKGLLHHVGFTSSMPRAERAALTRKLEQLIELPGFTGNAPGGPSRWSTKRSTEWEPLKPKLVVEVEYDHFTGGRFRHGTRLVRWRPDKSPRQCRMDQVSQAGAASLKLLTAQPER